ncbi:MAG: hypothetical protein LBI69_01250 [Puniceicoccales bacterium]|nr:hypothetical protein [Puniceicoccales bacterium]
MIRFLLPSDRPDKLNLNLEQLRAKVNECKQAMNKKITELNNLNPFKAMLTAIIDQLEIDTINAKEMQIIELADRVKIIHASLGLITQLENLSNHSKVSWIDEEGFQSEIKNALHTMLSSSPWVNSACAQQCREMEKQLKELQKISEKAALLEERLKAYFSVEKINCKINVDSSCFGAIVNKLSLYCSIIAKMNRFKKQHNQLRDKCAPLNKQNLSNLLDSTDKQINNPLKSEINLIDKSLTMEIASTKEIDSGIARMEENEKMLNKIVDLMLKVNEIVKVVAGEMRSSGDAKLTIEARLDELLEACANSAKSKSNLLSEINFEKNVNTIFELLNLLKLAKEQSPSFDCSKLESDILSAA